MRARCVGVILLRTFSIEHQRLRVTCKRELRDQQKPVCLPRSETLELDLQSAYHLIRRMPSNAVDDERNLEEITFRKLQSKERTTLRTNVICRDGKD